MAYKLSLSGIRGDALLIAVPLVYPGPPQRPLTAPEAQAIKDAWPTITMQVRQTADALGLPLLSLTALAGQISVQTAYAQADGTLAPVLLITADPSLTQTVIEGAVYDIEFSGAGTGPYTWIAGGFKLTQDVNRVSA